MTRIRCAIGAEPATAQSWADRWEGPDDGLVAAWQGGIDLASSRPDLVKRACAGELPELPWKGGLRKATKAKKWGPLHYVAMLQGLQRLDLDIDTEVETTLTCSATGGAVTFTADRNRWAIDE